MCALVSAGCVVSVSFDDADFRCTDEPICPEGRECVDGRCVVPSDPVDAGVVSSSFRQTLTIDPSLADTAIDAPILVRLLPSRIDYSRTLAFGSDLYFLDPQGTPLAHEIESWNAGGESIIWVRAARVAAGGVLYMHYGEPPAAPAPSNVWTTEELVYHFASEANDSSPGSIDGVVMGGAAAGVGQLGAACAFDGSGLIIADQPPLLASASAYTVSGWVNAAQPITSLFELTANAGTPTRLFFAINMDSSLEMGIRPLDVSPSTIVLAPIALGQWVWFMGVGDLANSELRLYIDGVEVAAAEGLAFPPALPSTIPASLYLGRDDLQASDFLVGSLDEIRIEPRLRDAAWARVQFRSMTDALITFGPEEPL